MMKRSTKYTLLYVAGVGVVLLIPLVAMQFTDEVKWTGEDFAIIALLLLGAGLIYTLLAQKYTERKTRMILAAVVAFAVLIIWAQLAVQIF